MELNWGIILLLVLLPLMAVGGVFIALKHMELQRLREEREWEVKKTTRKEITTVRLRAYERLALMLERTTPESMIMRLTADSNPALLKPKELETLLLTMLRAEFEHNMSQQIYTSEELWDHIIFARDEMAAFIHTIAEHLPEDASGTDYATTLMKAYSQNGTTPHQRVMEELKAEIRHIV